jgi:acyl-CoA dehydrogenase
MTLSPALLDRLLAPPPAPQPCPDVDAWWPRHRALATAWPSPIERSIAGGLAADRIGWAFATGYQAALRALLPGLAEDAIAAMCVTEDEGNAPRAIRTTLRDTGDGQVALDGRKRWTTLGPASGLLLVAAVDVRAATVVRPSIRVVRVPADAPGVTLRPMPPTRFVPEVPHAEVELAGVPQPASEVLPGDGWDTIVKPFRTVEDVHVTAAILAYALACGRRRRWPRDWSERSLSVLGALQDAAGRDPSAAGTHLLLAGTLALAHALLGEAGRRMADGPADDEAARWARDAALLGVAGGARAQRAARAWERVEGAAAG